MPTVGDRVRVASRKVDQAPRDGVVTDVIGGLLRIKWSTGEESTVAPGPGAIDVIGRVRTSSVQQYGTRFPTSWARSTRIGC